MTITKNDLISYVAELVCIRRDSAKVVVEQLLNIVKETVKEGKSLEIRGFGTFSPKNRNPRLARNLQTGELIPLAACKNIFFKFSPEIKNKITGTKKIKHVQVAAIE